MSGPKVVTYTMKAFSGKLSTLMRLQNQLKNQCKLLQKASIADNNLNISLDYRQQLSILQASIDKATAQMIFNYKTFEQDTYNIINQMISKRKDEVLDLIKQTDDLISDYEEKIKDYEAYKDYLNYFENSKNSFEKFKEEFSNLVVESLKEVDIKQYESATAKTNETIFNAEKQDFDWGFAKDCQDEKDRVRHHIIEQENVLKSIESDNINIVLNSGISRSVKSDIFLLNPTIPKKVKILSAKIQQIINDCDDTTIYNTYLDRLNLLKQSNSMTDIFYYQELHDNILKEENSRKFKRRISDSLSLLNEFEPHKTVSAEKIFLQQKAVKMIDSAELSEREWFKFRTRLQSFYANNRKAIEEDELKAREHLFIKAQIIHNLESKGYAVMEDLEVIDFEKENTFYLRIPGQENILNVIFREDGTFRYVFQIPEDKAQLSVEQQKLKLHEMQETCNDFTEVLSELRQMGVDLNIKSDKPVAMSSVITVPEAVAKKLEKQKSKIRKGQIKKLYLD